MVGFSFTVSDDESEAIYSILRENGFEENSQGLKKYLLAPDEEDEGTEEPEEVEGGVSSRMRKALEALRDNPELVNAIKKKGGRITASLVKKMFS